MPKQSKVIVEYIISTPSGEIFMGKVVSASDRPEIVGLTAARAISRALKKQAPKEVPSG